MAALAALSACDGEPEELDAAVIVDGGVEVDAFVEPCARRSDCDDARYCNGVESCEPGAADADARGCIAGEPPCLGTQICDDDAESCETDCETSPDGDGRRARACGGDDCDDSDGSRFPGATEVCDDGDVDEDCDPINTHGARDVDGDLHDAICCNVDEEGARRCSGVDCDDAIPSTNPAAADNTCDTVDNDCDTAVDEDAGAMVYYVDADGDGYGSEAAGAMLICGEPPPNYAPLPGDCRDDLPTVFPGAPQLCDRIENRCDGTLPGEARVIEDVDEDGFAALDADCEGGDLPKADCHDDIAEAYPGGTERCATDEVDENCDGAPLGGCPNGEVVFGSPTNLPTVGLASSTEFCTYAGDSACAAELNPTPVGVIPIDVDYRLKQDFFQVRMASRSLRVDGSTVIYNVSTPMFPVDPVEHRTDWYVQEEGTAGMTSCEGAGRTGLGLPVGVLLMAEADIAPWPLSLICDDARVEGEDQDAVLVFDRMLVIPDYEDPAPPATPPDTVQQRCRIGEVLVGFHGTHDGSGITQIGITCATLELEYHPLPAP